MNSVCSFNTPWLWHKAKNASHYHLCCQCCMSWHLLWLGHCPTALWEYCLLFFPKIHSSTSPLALISRKAQFPPELVERINTPSVFCLHPGLATCNLATSLGFIFSVVLSSNSRFASFDFVLHWLEFFHPPLSSFTVTLLALTKIPTVTFSQGGFYAQGGKRSPFQ